MSHIITSQGEIKYLVSNHQEIIKNLDVFKKCSSDFRSQLLRKAKIIIYYKSEFCPSRYGGYVGMNEEEWYKLYNLKYGLDGTATSNAIRKVLGQEEENELFDLELKNLIEKLEEGKKRVNLAGKKYWRLDDNWI